MSYFLRGDGSGHNAAISDSMTSADDIPKLGGYNRNDKIRDNAQVVGMIQPRF